MTISNLEDAAIEFVRNNISVDEVYTMTDVLECFDNRDILEEFNTQDIIDFLSEEDIFRILDCIGPNTLDEYLDRQEGWEHVGQVAVDAGCVWLGDPCYIIDNSQDWTRDWIKFCEKTSNSHDKGYLQINFDSGHNGLGVLVHSGYGDGNYPVYIKKENNRVKEVKIVFF